MCKSGGSVRGYPLFCARYFIINCTFVYLFILNFRKPIFMLWRKFNGDPIQLPIKDAVAQAITRETTAGFHLKVCIGTDSQVKGKETEFATVIVFCVKAMAASCLFTTKKQHTNTALRKGCW